MRGIDKPTGRVVALIVLLIAVGTALHGYLPADNRAAHAESGGGKAAQLAVIAALAGTLVLLAVAIIARLRGPRAVAPEAGELPELLGRGSSRPNWRVLLIGLGVIVAWLLIAMLLAWLLAPDGVTSSPPTSSPPTSETGPASAHGPAPPSRQQHPRTHNGDMLAILLAATLAMLLIIVAGSAILARRRWLAFTPSAVADDHIGSVAPPTRSESLVRAAELGLAEIGDLSREPREAIISCYAAMERELANVPEAAPQDYDTPTEVLVRAVEQQALRADNAAQLVNLFAEARFSPHVMDEGHREVAVRVLRLVLAELWSPV